MYLVKNSKGIEWYSVEKLDGKKFPASFLKPLPKPHVSPPKSNQL